uniref:Glutathione-dependent dehydroascorbate reductase n=1 Tax=Pristionchus pacificus TaxID=54126 RepID=A0A8R1YQM2_PRIPA
MLASSVPRLLTRNLDKYFSAPPIRLFTPRNLRSLASIFRTFLTTTAAMPSSLVGKNSHHLKSGDPEPAPLVPGAARIYSMKFCPFAQRALIYLAKKGIRTEIININLASKPEWYFAKNPKGTVPTFERDGQVVFESLIVPEFLDGIYPDTSIISADPYTRAKQRILVEQLSVVVGGYVGIFLALKDNKSDDDIKEAVGKCKEALDECEKLATYNAPFFAGLEPGFPDYMVFGFFDRVWAMVTGTLPESRPTLADDLKQFTVSDFPGCGKWPRLTRWFQAMEQLEEVKASRQPFEIQKEFLKTYAGGNPEYDIGA